MNALKSLCFGAVAGLALAACGGSDVDDIVDANPGYSALSLDMTGDDGDAAKSALDGVACHPHLFQRTRLVVRRVNHHTLKLLARIDAIIDRNPTATSGATATWERDVGAQSFKVVGTKVSDTSYTFEVSAKAKADAASAYVVVATGTNSRAIGDAAGTGKGSFTFNFGKLNGAIKTEKATGTIQVDFDVTATKKTLIATLTDFQPDDGEVSPRNAKYVFSRERGVGGSLKFQDEMVLACPENAAKERSSVNTVSQWSVKGGKAAFRADSTASGGPIASGKKVVAVTCGDMNKAEATAEAYWMMKAVDSSGATVASGQFSRAKGSDAPTTCDAVFGAVPNADDSSTDFDFTKVDFTSSAAFAYPTN